MAVLDADLKLMRSERLGDTDDAGGRMSGTEVVDGASNNLFPDVSALDRTIGRVNIAKAFLNVATPNTDNLYGAHVILDDAPDDPAVSATLFTTANWFDHRADHQNHIESYLARGGKWQGYVYETQLAGQRAIQIIQRENVAIPDVGTVFVLIGHENLSDEFYQFVRVTAVSSLVQSFYNASANHDFTRRVVTLTISDPLLYNFIGYAATEGDPTNSTCVLRTTIVADAAKYYGIQPLHAAASSGQFSVTAETIYNQLVPGATQETPMVDLTVTGTSGALIAGAGSNISFTLGSTLSPGVSLYLGNPCVPGTLTITATGLSMTDKAGDLIVSGTAVGTIDYAHGQLNFSASAGNYTGTKTVSFRPAGQPVRVQDTASVPIDASSRGYAYALTLAPIPAPGTLTISYRAMGKWYDLVDSGDGLLLGSDTSFGAGSLNFTTGSILLTLGALPDIGADLLFSWGAAPSTFDRSEGSVLGPAYQYTTVTPGIVPGSLTITWLVSAVTKTAVDNGSGTLSGDALGSVEYTSGKLVWRPTFMVAPGTQFTIAYQTAAQTQEVFTNYSLTGTTGTFTLAHQPVVGHSVQIDFNLTGHGYYDKSGVAVDRAETLTIHDVPGGGSTGTWDNGVTGSINYTTGAISVNVTRTIDQYTPHYTYRGYGVNLGGGWVYDGLTLTHDGQLLPPGTGRTATVTYRYATTPTAQSETYTPASSLALDLTDRYAETIVPGSVRFTLGGKTYIDRLGQLYADVDALSGAGTLAGSLDYDSGQCSITYWSTGGTSAVALKSLLTDVALHPVASLRFRIPIAPVRSGSVQIRATPLGGSQISATADSNGNFSVTGMIGTVDYLTGVVKLRFGQMVTAAGNETQPWYDAAQIVSGQIFKPIPVYAETIRYDAVATTYMPLPADLLGLDPVRLPIDGRVPIFRKGDVAVVHHTGTVAVSSPTAGSTLDLGRTRLARVWVQDSLGVKLATSLYSVDLNTGILTWANPLVLTGYTGPYTVYQRIEDMSLVSDVEISGKLTFTRPITHDFPTGSQVSSALLIGDLQARYTSLFEQGSWTNVWQDSLIGSAPVAVYDDLNYPLTVRNDGATQERWALIFTNSTTYRCVGQNVGEIANGISTTVNFSPTNPATGHPYFTIQGLGFGGGWSTGNVLRFNTIAANYPFEVARTILQSSPTLQSDRFSIQIRGDSDHP